ncbi:ATP-binding protein [Burkholderia sp. AU38729]|uniref:ATP-binding protein n=1 Tax=Burkholderia sp. AU38729 TaxID=2879633 RepID=UPI001CF23CAF|nr:ATP-binding protein [Burkholderia sp. AU38729]MCA8066459.1 response regulator [Burkholderia sp. AU38729]
MGDDVRRNYLTRRVALHFGRTLKNTNQKKRWSVVTSGRPRDEKIPRIVAARRVNAPRVGSDVAAPTYPGAATVALSVSASAVDATPVTIRVSDSGIGMTPDQLAHIFEPFAQPDRPIARRFGGAGIGLALSHKLVESMGGNIVVDSVPGVGSTFVITLPLPLDHRPGAARADANADAPNARVLFVDDNAVNRSLIHDQLDVLGYPADVASSVAEALDLVDRHDYALVMTDLNMPGLDGYAFARVLRERGRARPILTVTAHAEPDEMRLAREAGIDEIAARTTSLKSLELAITKHTGPSKAPHSPPPSRRHGPLPHDLHKVLSDTAYRSNGAIARALQDGDLKAASREIHSMRGAFAMLGEHEISEVCASMEALALAGDAAAFAREFERYRHDANEILVRRAAGESQQLADTFSDISAMK